MDEVDAEIDGMDGHPEAKRRLKILRRTIGGQMSDEEARRALGLRQAELEQMRRDMLQGMADAIASAPSEDAFLASEESSADSRKSVDPPSC